MCCILGLHDYKLVRAEKMEFYYFFDGDHYYKQTDLTYFCRKCSHIKEKTIDGWFDLEDLK